MQITDINCFVGYLDPEIPLPEYTAECLKEKMDCYGISHSVVYAKEAINAPMRGNAVAKELEETSGGRITACYVLGANLGSQQLPSSEKLLEQLRKERPGAIRLFPLQNRFRVDSFYCGELLEVISRLRIPLLLESDEMLDYVDIPNLSAQYPDIPFVFLQVGLRMGDFIRPLVQKRKNVYFEISKMIDTGFLDEMVHRYGSEKFLFGSGMPYMDPTGPLGMVLYGDFQSKAKENIFYQNWNRLQEGIQWE